MLKYSNNLHHFVKKYSMYSRCCLSENFLNFIVYNNIQSNIMFEFYLKN